MKTLKISFDFDGCLSELRQQETAKQLIKLGADVYCSTNHSKDDNNDELFNTCKEVGIEKNHIQLCGDHNKSDLLDGFDFHFDDSMDDITEIQQQNIVFF